jgi:hypothetical protein
MKPLIVLLDSSTRVKFQPKIENPPASSFSGGGLK